MKTGRELLESAAKAFGLKGHYAEKHPEFGDDWVETGFWYNNEDDCTTVFNSLTREGDAFRLAMKLGLIVDFWHERVMSGERHGRGWVSWVYADEFNGSMNHAITYAAAMMHENS